MSGHCWKGIPWYSWYSWTIFESIHCVITPARAHTSYLPFFYTTAIWGQEILHLKVRKFATKLSVKFFTLCNFYTVCKAIFRVPIWLTTSGCNGRNKYQVWMWNEIFISLSCGSKNPIGHPTTQEYILMGDFLKNFPFWTF